MISIYGVFSEDNGAHGALVGRINTDLTGQVSSKTEGSNGVLACYADASESTVCKRRTERPVGTSSHCQRHELGVRQRRAKAVSGFPVLLLRNPRAQVCHAPAAAMLRAAATA
jgi:hypothetical protein